MVVSEVGQDIYRRVLNLLMPGYTCKPIIVATLCVFCSAASAVSTFLELPANQTDMDSGDATLSCNATVNGTRHSLSYKVGNGAGGTLQSVGGNITDLSLVDGAVGACVFGEYRTQLILKGSRVTREADGYTVDHVHCTGWTVLC